MQDPTCQQIMQDQSRWVGVAQAVRQDWNRCFQELQNFENLLEEDRIRRYRWHKWFKYSSYFLTVFMNVISGAAALVPMLNYDMHPAVGYTLSTITFIASFGAWTGLGNRSEKFLGQAKDNAQLREFCKTIRLRLREVMEDGKITSQERALIRDMMGQMHKRSQEVGSMDLIVKILGGGSFTSQANAKNYQIAFDGISQVINDIGRTQKVMEVKAPEALREYQDVQLQAQIHSNGIQVPHLTPHARIVTLQHPGSKIH